MLSKIRGMFDKVVTSSITVNGQTFVGNNVSVVNGRVIVDGKPIDIPEAKEINITVHGDLEFLKVDRGAVTVTGDVGVLTAGHGNVEVSGDVKGEVTLDMGSLQCGDIFGNVEVDMGNVSAGTIHGSAKTKMGNIN